MAKHRTHSIAFKRQIVQEYLAGETFYNLSRRHDLSRTQIRIWVDKYKVGAFDEEAAAALGSIRKWRRNSQPLSFVKATHWRRRQCRCMRRQRRKHALETAIRVLPNPHWSLCPRWSHRVPRGQ